MNDRFILHCDLNAFFASVEEVRNTELRAYPVAVCGNPENRHGIILAKNEKAKAFGVKTAETIWTAQKKCPNLVLVPPHYDEYSRYSKIVNDIYLRYTDLVEPFGIDESWLDVTGSAHLFGTPEQIANEIRHVIKKETGLTISVGVSFTKAFAKLGSDYKKPDATTVITRENYKDIVWPLPVTDLLFVGRSAKKTFERLGIITIGDLAKSSRKAISSLLGKTGELVHDYANGIDDSPVASAFAESDPKSIGRGITFPHNLTDFSEIKTGISVLSDDVASRLRKKGLKAQVVSLTVRDPSFKTTSRQKTLSEPTHLESEITGACIDIYNESYSQKSIPVRMLTVTVSNLIDDALTDSGQLSLFGDNKSSEKQESVELTIDKIRNKFGHDSMIKGSFLNKDFSIRKKDD
ncbi:MAG: DNA polymerase IV [Oscillospiraceae bacterium]|nr:DNA polymerase IV [Oscillospiraceae bacterium]